MENLAKFHLETKKIDEIKAFKEGFTSVIDRKVKILKKLLKIFHKMLDFDEIFKTF